MILRVDKDRPNFDKRCLWLHAGYQVEVPAFAKRAALQVGFRMLVGVLSTPTPEKNLILTTTTDPACNLLQGRGILLLRILRAPSRSHKTSRPPGAPGTHEPLSKLLVSPLITPIVVPYMIPYIAPV